MTATTTKSGFSGWVESIRSSMTNDPCRQLFDDQVQNHGFIFLDDYLDNILQGARQGPMIDLLKTPGRKRDAPPKARVGAVAATKQIDFTSLDQQDAQRSSAEIPPVNRFHKALLQAKEKALDDTPERHLEPGLAEDAPSLSSEATSIEGGRWLNHPFSKVNVQESTTTISGPPDHAPATTEQPGDLSVIAECDEERSGLEQSPIQPRRVSGNELVVDEFNAPSPSPVETTTYESVGEIANRVAEPTMNAEAQKEACSPAVDAPPGDESLPAAEHGRIAPSPRASSPSEHNGSKTDLNPTVQSHSVESEMTVPLRASPSGTLARKSSVPHFPNLPAPSPLRKSMRVQPAREPSMSVQTPGPSAAPTLGKRSSWLMKAREVKALEGPGSSIAAKISNTLIGTKRKSGEIQDLIHGKADEERKSKVAKYQPVELPQPPTTSTEPADPGQQSTQAMAQGTAADETEITVPLKEDGDESMMGRFKRTVEGLGARAGKSMGRSLGGTAAAALAEARAAAEARVAERHKAEGDDVTVVVPVSPDSVDALPPQPQLNPLVSQPQSDVVDERRLSVSDLVRDGSKASAPKLALPKPFDDVQAAQIADESISTTPPNSPPPAKQASDIMPPSGPVFNKPPPHQQVFVAPVGLKATQPSVEFSFTKPSPSSLPAAIDAGVSARPLSPQQSTQQRQRFESQKSIQPSQESEASNSIFDKESQRPAWMVSTQETEHTENNRPRSTLDDDDSWPLDEKLAAEQQGWTPFNFGADAREDSMTWSSAPTRSQTGPTRSHDVDMMEPDATSQEQPAAKVTPRAIEDGSDAEAKDISMEVEPYSDVEDGPAEDMAGDEDFAHAFSFKPTIKLVEKEPSVPRSQSQLSLASSSSSQSHAGFFNQASRLMNSVLGGNKKAKPEIKSLQLAAAAAKKQQEELDKKATRQKEAENRRHLAAQKKAEEEKARALEEEKKAKEEGEKRKREREEQTDKRQLKAPSAKKPDDDAFKKRKIAPPETEKKLVEQKKQHVKEKKELIPPSKTLVTSNKSAAALVKPAKSVAHSVLVSSTAYNSSQSHTAVASTSAIKTAESEVKTFKAAHTTAASSKGKSKAKVDDAEEQPSQTLQGQMAARAKAQMQAVQQTTKETITSESIELPEIRSEYSDSEDEDRAPTFDRPDWAQSPELLEALRNQRNVNPDDIFGAIRPLRMEELFRTRQSRFRARTSSANWSGADRLTAEEEREYARRMGFQ